MADGSTLMTTSVSGSTVVIHVSGALHAGDADALATMLAGLGHGGQPVIVDLSRAELIDAAVARALKQAMAAATRAGTSFAAVGATSQPLGVLEVLGLAKDLGAYDSLPDAIAGMEVGRNTAGRPSLDATVHRLLDPVTRRDPADPERRHAVVQAIEAALPLARSMAHRYQQRGEPLDDLIQVASLGVVRSVQGYDAERGSGFLAYAVPTILGELRRHFRDHVWTVRPPRRLQEVRSAITGAVSDLAQHLGREPTPQDIADHLDYTVAEVEQAMLTSSGLRPASLDAPVAPDAERSLHETVGSPDSEVDMIDYRASLAPLIAAEPPMVREILNLRFVAGLTQSEIAQRVGTSQMNVSRTLRATLARFKRALLAAD